MASGTKSENKSSDWQSLDEVLHEAIGPPALLKSESAAAYHALYEEARLALQPRDVIEEIWVREYVDLTWEMLRLRRQAAKLYSVARPAAIETAFQPMFENDSPAPVAFAIYWAKGSRKARKRVDSLLARAGFDEGALEAVTLSEHMDYFERIHQLLAENQRHQAMIIRDLEGRQEKVSIRRLRPPRAYNFDDAQIGTGPAS